MTDDANERKPQTVGVDVLARWFKMTPRAVQMLAKDGMPKAERGQYPLVACVQWYIEELKRQRDAKANSEVIDKLTSERARKETALADLNEHELAKARAELVDIDYMGAQVEKILAAIAGEIRNAPAQLLRDLTDAKIIPQKMMRRARHVLDQHTENLLAALQTAGDDLDSDEAANTRKR